MIDAASGPAQAEIAWKAGGFVGQILRISGLSRRLMKLTQTTQSYCELMVKVCCRPPKMIRF
jgi:hypothetical protein